MKQYPFVGICVCFMSGIIVAKQGFLASSWFAPGVLGLFFCLCLIGLWMKYDRWVTFGVYFILIGLGYNFQIIHQEKKAELSRLKGKYVFYGRILKPVKQKGQHKVIEIELKELGGTSCNGRIKAGYREKVGALTEGLYVRGIIYFIGSEKISDSGFREFLKNWDYLGWGWIDSIEVVREGWRGWVNWTYQRLYNYIEHHYTGFTQHLAMALVLGNKHFFLKEERHWFQQAGTVHLLAVSGMHVGILFGFLSIIAHFIGLLGIRPVWLYLFFIPLLLFYAILTGESVSAFRSVLMTGMFLGQGFLPRPMSRIQVLGLSAFVQLVWSPSLLFQPGFQFSYGAMSGIFLLSPFLRVMYKNAKGVLRWCMDSINVSFSAQWGVFPFLLFYWKKFPLYFLFANLLIVPLVVLFCYTLFFEALLVLLDFGSGILNISQLIVETLGKCIEWGLVRFAHLPGSEISFSTKEVIGLGLLIWCLLLPCIVWVVKRVRRENFIERLLQEENSLFYRFAL